LTSEKFSSATTVYNGKTENENMISENFILCVLVDRLSDNGGRNHRFQSSISECAELNEDMND
jgi:hypothetical protein